MVPPIFFNLSLSFAVRSSWTEPQSAPSLVFAACIELLHSQLGRIQSDFGIDHLVMSLCRVICCVVGRGCLLWPVRSLGRTLLAFACFILYFRAKFAYSSGISWLSTFAFQFPIMKRTSFLGVLKGLVGLHRTIQLQLLQHYWSKHRLGLLWYWMVCLGNEQRSFCCFWDCIQVLHFRLLLTMMAAPFLLRDSWPQ